MAPATTKATAAATPDAATAAGVGGIDLAIQIGAYLAVAVVLGYFGLTARGFAGLGNIVNVVEQSAVLGILALGMTVVIIAGGTNVVSGGIDLSIAANMGVSASVFARSVSAGLPDPLALALTLGTGLVIGGVNAFAVIGLGVLPLLTTLAVMNICLGAELVLTQNTVVSASSPLVLALSSGSFLGISAYAWSLIAASAVFILLVHYSRWGLRLYAVGAHREAAYAAGLPVTKYQVGSYVIAGLCGSLAALLSVARLSGSSPGANDNLLPVLVAALMGVVFSRRMVPTIGGTLLSALFIGFLANGFQLVNVSSYWVNGVQGLLILAVVAMTSLSKRAGA